MLFLRRLPPDDGPEWVPHPVARSRLLAIVRLQLKQQLGDIVGINDGLRPFHFLGLEFLVEHWHVPSLQDVQTQDKPGANQE
jgi:hypothetical protein